MSNLILRKITLKLLTAKQERLSHHAERNAGFSLIEVVVVVLMVGILAAMAIPSWLAFINRQQVNKANDVILSALQEAQREAKRQKLSYSVSFTNDSNTPYFVIYPANVTPTADKWKILLSDLGTNPRKLVIGTNLTNANTGSATVNYLSALRSSFSSSDKPTQTITFDYTGALDLQVKTKTDSATSVQQQKLVYDAATQTYKGLIVSVAVAKSDASTEPTGVKRCVVLTTILGAIKTEKDTKCQ